MILSTAKFSLKRIFKNSGFTLLELVVVFSVLAILSTIGIASYVSFSRSQALSQAYLDFFNTVSIARAKAASQVKPSQCIAASTLNGYRVSINIAADSYTLSVVCSNIDHNISTKILSGTGIIFNALNGNPPTTTTDIFFSVLTSGVENPGDVVMSYPSQTSLSAKTLTVTSVGGIQ